MATVQTPISTVHALNSTVEPESGIDTIDAILFLLDSCSYALNGILSPMLLVSLDVLVCSFNPLIAKPCR